MNLKLLKFISQHTWLQSTQTMRWPRKKYVMKLITFYTFSKTLTKETDKIDR